MGASISRISGGLPAPQWQALRRTAAFKGLTPTSVLFAAYVHVLAGWSASPHFTLNCAFFSRDESLDRVPPRACLSAVAPARRS